MMTRDERLRYWERIDAARSALLADPEIAADYDRASRAWDSTLGNPARGVPPRRPLAEHWPAGSHSG
jgi:hypothetical protein